MGIWEQDSSGYSFSGDGKTVWGDPFADIMDDAVAKIIASFEECLGRPPTVGEIKSGLRFSLSFLGDCDDMVLFTKENREQAWTNRDDPENAKPLAMLADDWAQHCKGSYS